MVLFPLQRFINIQRQYELSDPDQNPLIELWPVTILRRRLRNCREVNDELIKLFREYRQEHSTAPHCGFISPDNFANNIDNRALDILKSFITDGVYQISKKLNEKYWKRFALKTLRVDVTGMWFQISNGFTFHETHVHGNCSWSGVYYVQAGSASRSDAERMPNGMLNGVTRFYGPHLEESAAGHGDWGNYYLQDNTWTSYPEDGCLIIFPSYLKHMAFPYNGEKDRIIVSFHAQVNSDSEIQYKYGFN